MVFSIFNSVPAVAHLLFLKAKFIIHIARDGYVAVCLLKKTTVGFYFEYEAVPCKYRIFMI